jgi:hypothetical protein
MERFVRPRADDTLNSGSVNRRAATVATHDQD